MATLSSATCWRDLPFTTVKSPPIATHLPSGEVAMLQTGPLTFGANRVGTPVVRLNAARYFRAASPSRAALPGGRIRVNSPPAKTVFPVTASAFTLALVCQVTCLTADNADANPVGVRLACPPVAATTGRPDGTRAAATTAAAVTTARTAFFMSAPKGRSGGRCQPMTRTCDGVPPHDNCPLITTQQRITLAWF